MRAILLLVIPASSILGCKEDATSIGSSDSGLAAAGSGNGFTFVSTDFFANVVPPSGTNMILHAAESADWSIPCRIESTRTAQNIACILEAAELDLYALDIAITLNFPGAMCTYSDFYPYYYYQYKPGVGPTAVTITKSDGVTNSRVPAAGPGTGISSYVGDVPVCAFDYSGAQPSKGPNCCAGKFNLTTTDTSTAQPPVAPQFSSTLVDWGGSYSKCLAGPGVDTQEKDRDDYPTTTLTYLNGTTLNTKYEIASSVSKRFLSNAYAANYFNDSPDFLPINAPLALQPPSVGMRGGQPFYELRCLDNAAEIKNRIVILIRSWSTQSEFGVRGNDIKSGPQPVFNFNDYFRFSTWMNGFVNSYPKSSN